MASIGSLLKKTIFRVFAFAIMITIGSFVFSILERKHAENTTKSSKETLATLRKEMALKYNMTNEEFDSFAERSREVLGQIGGPKWDYVDSLRFAFETLTTIGKEISFYSMYDACVFGYVKCAVRQSLVTARNMAMKILLSSKLKIFAWKHKNQLYANFSIA